ncbi:hypothetical protein THTE_2606 [Thermogutta terrifontis]|uniref:Uncharacterized protein n=1 Tax=Thermogutta terrifontis TaxID=1331910 RepID=A0A286RGX1_9BACT|nr:hypothetical protein THTE_2606 [Thermogutta terrifontis]
MPQAPAIWRVNHREGGIYRVELMARRRSVVLSLARKR